MKDLTVGKPGRVLLAYSLPLFGSIIFQQLYNIADSLVDEASIVKLLKDIHNLSFTSPLYGVYRNPDFGRQLPDTLPLLAFDKQPLNKPLEIALPA